MFVIAGLGFPIPEEVAIVGAGLWTASHAAEYPLYRWLMLPVCVTGVIIADMLLYGMGRLFGTTLLKYRWTGGASIPSPKARKLSGILSGMA